MENIYNKAQKLTEDFLKELSLLKSELKDNELLVLVNKLFWGSYEVSKGTSFETASSVWFDKYMQALDFPHYEIIQNYQESQKI
jgi:hypothetical protein